MSSPTSTLTPTRLPGLRAALARAVERLFDTPLLARPAPLVGAVALLAACAAGVLVALGGPVDLPAAATLAATGSAG